MSVHTRSDFSDQGFNSRWVQHHVDQGTLRRVRQGAYSDRETADAVARHRLLVDATLTRFGPDTVISHTSAALLRGWPVPVSALSHVTGTRDRNGSGGGDISPWAHTYSGSLAACEKEVIGGIAVTSAARTAADAARLLSRRDAVVLLDAALHVDREQENVRLRAEIAAQLRRDSRRRGAQHAMESLALANGLAESPGETVSRLIFHDAGLPEPVLQFKVYNRFEQLIAQTDMGWPYYRLLGECDGRVKYQQLLRPGEHPADVVLREKHRESDAQMEGWRFFRWAPAECERPAVLCARLRRMFEICTPHSA